MNLLAFQQKAVELLTEAFKRAWAPAAYEAKGKAGKIVFKSPTGSGKTFMVSSFIDGLQREPDFDADVAFVWITFSDDLARQSREKYERYFYPNVGRRLLGVEDISPNGVLLKNDILFLNWQKLVSRKAEDRRLRRPEDENRRKESGNYFEDLVEATHAAGREIVLVIDESHLHVSAAAERDVIGPLAPRVTLHVSATPKEEPAAGTLPLGYGFVEVRRDDVIAEGLIKEEIVSQTTEELSAAGERDLDKALLDFAIEKKETLATEWRRIGLNINPLILIQLPSDDAAQRAQEGLARSKKDVVLEYLAQKGVPESKVALWFDNEKKNLERISEDDCEVDFLLFKFAAGTGWDCPRAHVIVMFREIGTETFKTQVLGRVLRNPAVGKDLSAHPALRRAYLYTNYSKNALCEAAREKDAPPLMTEKTSMADAVLKNFAAEELAGEVRDAIAEVIVGHTGTVSPEHEAKIREVHEKVFDATRKALEEGAPAEITTETLELAFDDAGGQADSAATADATREHARVSALRASLGKICADVPEFAALPEDGKKTISAMIEEKTGDLFEIAGRVLEKEFVIHPAMRSDFISRADYGDFVSAAKFQKSFCESMNAFFGINASGEALDFEPIKKLEEKGIDVSGTYARRVIVDTMFASVDANIVAENANEATVEVSDNDAEKEFALQCAEILKAQTDEATKISNVARSWSVLKGALSFWFTEYAMKPAFDNETKNYRVFLKDVKNPAGSVFKEAITKALLDYSRVREELLRVRRAREAANAHPFKIKTDYSVPGETEILETRLSALTPFRIRKSYAGRNNEKAFIEFIDAQENALAWWFKNPDSGTDAFSLIYESGAERKEKMFCPDWILKFKDGRVGIFDTKSGITAQNLDGRDQGLFRKIKAMNEAAGKTVFIGGIVIPANGMWYYNDSEVCEYHPNDIEGDPKWKNMRELF